MLYRHPTERNPEAISRIETHRSQHAGTVGARLDGPSRLTKTLSRRKTEKPLSEMGAGKPYPPPLPDREEYVVEFMGVDDPLHAQNWPMKKKLGIATLVAYLSLAVTMGSSIFSPATPHVAREFGVSNEAANLGTSLFVFGYAFGPLVSEVFAGSCVKNSLLMLERSGLPCLSCTAGSYPYSLDRLAFLFSALPLRWARTFKP